MFDPNLFGAFLYIYMKKDWKKKNICAGLHKKRSWKYNFANNTYLPEIIAIVTTLLREEKKKISCDTFKQHLRKQSLSAM